jgi:hypothetical protein
MFLCGYQLRFYNEAAVASHTSTFVSSAAKGGAKKRLFMQLYRSKIGSFTSLKNFLLICPCGASFTVNTIMKKVTRGLLVLLLVITQVAQAQKDEALEKRLKEFLAFNETMQIDKVLDYTYPKLFTIAPKAQMLEAMQNAFDNEEMKITMDTLKVQIIYPVFTLGSGSYAKIDYSLIMTMHFKDTTTNTAELVDAMKSQFTDAVAKPNGVLVIKQLTAMVAIKDDISKEWTFVNLKENDSLTGRLLSKELLAKLATYK